MKPNQVPVAVGSIPAQNVFVRDTVEIVVSGYFSDPDGDALSYAVESSDTGLVTAAVLGDTVRVVAVAEGSAIVTVTASDPEGLFAEQSFSVTVPDLQSAILETFYEATGGADWDNNDNWLTDAPLDEWHGVEVNSRGRVTSLLLFGNNLEGTIPPELGGLTSLEKLFLPGNNLKGTLPPRLGNLWSLKRLDLSGNGLTGGFPAELGDLTSLVLLSLHSNSLTGTIPPELGRLSELDYVHLGGNELEGSIPAELGRLTKLNVLSLNTNKLSGTLPPELGNLSSAILINLAGNELSGTIPPELGDLELLDAFDVSKNRLQGLLPSTFVKLGELDRFAFSDNDGLCAPRNAAFSTWLQGVEDVDGPRCGDADRTVLEELYGVAGGPNWTESGGWLQAEDLDDWYGVTTDSFGYVSEIDLEDNGLRGRVPFEIGDLETVRRLEIGTNDLSGPLPLRMTGLRLERFGYADTGLCELDDEEFQEWLDGIPSLEGTGRECFDPRKALAAFYDATGGPGWTEDWNWKSDAPLAEWFGVETDEDGQVTSIELWMNGLSGRLPPELGDLPRLERLRLELNNLSGPIPPELGKVASLRFLALGGNRLTGNIPLELIDLPGLEVLWLGMNHLSGPIPPELGKLSSLTSLSLHTNRLTGTIPPELSQLANLSHVLHLAWNEFTGTIPPELGDLTRLRALRLDWNFLSGRIPPELGKMSSLAYLDLAYNRLTGTIPPELGDAHDLFSIQLNNNQLTGSIPEELGDLSELYQLELQDNRLTGSIPAELGNLAELEELWLYNNRLTGSIPVEMGRLSQLVEFHVGNNDLGGSLPSELGDLSNLRTLNLSVNDFSGALPAEFASLDRLRHLGVSNNPKLAGPIPMNFTRLANVETLIASGTGLCAPDEATFLDWLKRILNRRVKICGHDNSTAYLIQSTQTRDVPVPLVSDREALLRVFVTATGKTDEKIPPVVARFYRNGSETYEVTIPGKSVAIPTEVDEGSLDKSSNAPIPDAVVRPGLEMVIEIDPENTLEEGLLARKRIPEEGRLKVEVDTMPAFDLTLVPFLWVEDPDSSVLRWTEEMADEDEEHEMLRLTYDVLPVEDLNVSEHDPVESSSNITFELLEQVYAMRKMEDGSGYWLGLMTGLVWGPALGYVGAKASFSTVSSVLIAHELGHNLNNRHAQGCRTPRADRFFPQPDGSIGVWGYDHRAGKLVSPSTKDVMTYCPSPNWISDYFFAKMVRYRLAEAEDQGSPSPYAEGPGILLWGGIDAEGEPSLEPAFVVDAPPTEPPGPGPHTLTGMDAAGARLFSFSFDMMEISHAEGETAHFAFVLPVEPEWPGALASITLAAPGGSVTLDGDTDAPMAIVRDIRSGQVRAFLRGLSEPPALRADFQVYWSRGIPNREAWER